MLTLWQQGAAAAAGIAGGVLSGFFGVGGNVILVPLLGLALGLTQQEAQGVTLAALLPPLGLPAVWQYRRSGVPLLWPVVGFAIVGFLPGIPLGSALANVLAASTLRALFALLLAITAVRTWRAPREEVPRPDLLQLPQHYIATSLLAGFGAGAASGLLGIGGAIVLIPLLVHRLGMSQKQAQLTSLAMLLPPVALPGVWVYALAQNGLPWGALLPVALGFIGGAFLGARLNGIVSPAGLTRAFAVLVGISAVLLLVSALR